MPTSIWGYLAALLLGAAIATGLTHAVDRNHYEAQINALEAQHAKQLKAVSDLAADRAKQALADQQQMNLKLAQLDAQRTKELSDAKHENDRLRAAVDAGTVRLRIAVAQARAASGDAVPQGAGAASLGHDAVDLAPEARQAYFDLRDALTEDAKKIATLQDYVRGVCLK